MRLFVFDRGNRIHYRRANSDIGAAHLNFDREFRIGGKLNLTQLWVGTHSKNRDTGITSTCRAREILMLMSMADRVNQ